MEIDITDFFEHADPFNFSASIVERGQNAGPETWGNARREAAEAPLLTTPEQLDALRAHVKGFGAWSEKAIDAWDDRYCNALFIQLISGDIRAAFDDAEPDWKDYQRRAENGQCSGNLFKAADGRVYYDLSS